MRQFALLVLVLSLSGCALLKKATDAAYGALPTGEYCVEVGGVRICHVKAHEKDHAETR